MTNNQPLSKEDIQFLQAFKNERLTQDNLATASPVYWGIMDYEWRPTHDDIGERTAVFCFDLHEDHSQTAEELAKSLLDYIDGDFLDSKLTWAHYEQLQSADSDTDVAALTDIMDKLNLQYIVCSEAYESYIRRNALFFTQKDADDWLKANKHNCTGDAHTYAMYGGYSNEVSRLFKILEQTDWSQFDAESSASER